MHSFTDEVSLTQRQSTTDWCTGTRCPLRIQRIDIEGQVNGGVVTDVSESHFNNATDTMTSRGQRC